MREIQLTTIQDMIENPVSTIQSELTDVSATITTLGDQLQSTTDKLAQVHTELKLADAELRKQSYVTTEQVERLIEYQLTTIDSLIVGLGTCTQLSTSVHEQLNCKIKRLTRFAAFFALISVAAVILALMR